MSRVARHAPVKQPVLTIPRWDQNVTSHVHKSVDFHLGIKKILESHFWFEWEDWPLGDVGISLGPQGPGLQSMEDSRYTWGDRKGCWALLAPLTAQTSLPQVQAWTCRTLGSVPLSTRPRVTHRRLVGTLGLA